LPTAQRERLNSCPLASASPMIVPDRYKRPVESGRRAVHLDPARCPGNDLRVPAAFDVTHKVVLAVCTRDRQRCVRITLRPRQKRSRPSAVLGRRSPPCAAQSEHQTGYRTGE
jgi:hypothetical protein